jgi:hypothetical protein
MMDHGFFDGPWGGGMRSGGKAGIEFLRKLAAELHAKARAETEDTGSVADESAVAASDLPKQGENQ